VSTPFALDGGISKSFCSTVAVVIWVMENQPVTPSLHLEIDGVYDGGVGDIACNNPEWEKRD
jgi:hypothetical protein